MEAEATCIYVSVVAVSSCAHVYLMRHQQCQGAADWVVNAKPYHGARKLSVVM